MGQLSATLAPLGWTIPIVPEIDDLTVGKKVTFFGSHSFFFYFILKFNKKVSYLNL